MEWNEETIQRLRGFWAEGLSTAEIGRRLGVSKNSVVGKAHRLDLTARPSPIRWDRDPAAPRPRRPATAPRPSGPTLPPLGSASLPPPRVAAAAPPPRPAAVPSMHAPAAPDMRAPAMRAPAMHAPAMHAPVSPAPARAPIAPPPRPAAPPPRLQAVPTRAYGGRIVTCCWPLGEPGTKEFHFCDAASVPGKPYCDEHAQIAYVKVRDRREDAA